MRSNTPASADTHPEPGSTYTKRAVWIDVEDHAALKRLAKLEGRTIKGTVRVLVEQRLGLR